MNKNCIIQTLVLLVLLAFISGCSGSQVRLNMSSTANLNLNGDSDPLPVVVNIYQLSVDHGEHPSLGLFHTITLSYSLFESMFWA